MLDRAREQVVSLQIVQIATLAGATSSLSLVDCGYRGAWASVGTRPLVGRTRRMPRNLKKMLKRQQMVDPLIGEMKTDEPLDRSWLKAALGDAVHALVGDAGHHFRVL